MEYDPFIAKKGAAMRSFVVTSVICMLLSLVSASTDEGERSELPLHRFGATAACALCKGFSLIGSTHDLCCPS